MDLGDVLLDDMFGANVGMAVELWTVSVWLNKLFAKYLRVACMGKIPRKGDAEEKHYSGKISGGPSFM